MSQERKLTFDPRTARTIAANLLLEDGANGGNPLTKRPEVRGALKHLKKDLKGISPEQIKEVLLFLSGNGNDQGR